MESVGSRILRRLRSPAVWTSLLTLILFILKKWIGITVEGVDQFVELLMGALVTFGILNNPDTRDSF